MLLPYMINRGSGLSSDVIHLCHKWQKKDGKTLTLRTRNQVYYNQNGWVRSEFCLSALPTHALTFHLPSWLCRPSGF